MARTDNYDSIDVHLEWVPMAAAAYLWAVGCGTREPLF